MLIIVLLCHFYEKLQTNSVNISMKYQVLELGIYFSFSFVDYALDIFVLR